MGCVGLLGKSQFRLPINYMSVFQGILFHAVGASCASLCYTPQRKLSGWSWQTYWLAQAAFCWLLLPLIIARITIPHLYEVLQEAPRDAMWKSFLLGAAYGIGGTAFGLAIRYVGFSLTYAISIGISCVLGTLLPPLLHGNLTAVFGKTGSSYIITGIALGALGIALCGWAGRYKETDLQKNKTGQSVFFFARGLPLCILAGVLSALYGFSLDQGQPIANVAAKYGAGYLQGNVIYIFSNTGAFLTTTIYCIYLHLKQKTFGEYRQAAGARARMNFSMALLTGLLWYAQFFFYGLGHTRMGSYKFTSWAVHMIMLVLFSSVIGLFMKEWIACQPRTIRILMIALFVLISAVSILTYGNYLGDEGV
jgi:L-rhamnose-H+ transport protein